MDESHPIVEVSGLTKRYGDLVALDDVSFDIAPGETVGVLGPNGAGKTTLIKSMLGLIDPTAGTVRIADVDVTANPVGAYRHVGAMLEGARNVYWRLTVRENLAFFTRLVGESPTRNRARHARLLERFDLTQKATTAVNDLSRGQKQKVALACTLARDVDVVFLDEPTLGLDVESSWKLRTELARLTDEEGLTVLLSSHDMDVIEALCDRVIVIQSGSIVADDAVDELLGLFRSQSYRIDYDGRLPDALDAFDELEISESSGLYRLEMTAIDAGELVRILELLVAGDGVVTRIDTNEPDLEEAFLRLTEGERPPTRANPTSEVPAR